MTHRGSRTEGRTPTTGRAAAAYTTGPTPRDAPVLHCACGAAYRDYPDSHTAHRAVFGHQPVRKPAPATAAESAPEQHQEGQVWTG